MTDAILTALGNVTAPTVLLALMLGVVVGVIIGALPGLSATMGMAIFAPATFFLPPVEGISFLLALYKGGTFGGSLSAILIGTPGTASNAATVADGYAMTRAGKAGRALGLAVWGSVVGDGIGILALVLCAPLVAEFALQVGNAEKFAITVMSLTLVAYVSGNSLLKGLFAAAIGLALSLVGTDPIGGSPRLTFGVRELSAGIGVIPLAIGLFGLAEVLDQLARWRPGPLEAPRVEVPLLRDIFRRLWQVKWTIGRSSLIGAFIGALPGIGSETSNWVAYALARRASKTPEAFGKGADEGVVAPEVACNATCGAALIPTLIFGIPGDVVTSILMGALIAQGLQPGPTLITDNTGLFYTLYAGLFVSMVMLAFVGLAAMRFASRIILIPRPLLFTAVAVLCVTGTYAINARLFDVGVMVAAGFIGWGMRALQIPVASLVLAFVLGGILEDSFRRMLIQSRGELSPLWERPIALAVCLVTLAVIALALKGTITARFRNRAAETPTQ
ncbi:tripartite tricarboxylate transporter permease [Chachezhania antarctica]|uniref:tripartite tricarboxylate transporter permease n=1 Tax=Chachezhania antarctica TaxID=2340860 RepID=UPI000EB173DD|nr:tripartite tricarboxylate transporter permease [Chachezhania antarctica]